jgi:hypothetical protein
MGDSRWIPLAGRLPLLPVIAEVLRGSPLLGIRS